MILFIYLCLCWLLLRRLFSSCGGQALLLIVVPGLLTVVASLGGAQALGHAGFSICGVWAQ